MQTSVMSMKVALFFVLLFSGPVVLAGSAVDALDGFFNDIKAFSADFQQSVTSEDAFKSQSSSGRMALRRPGQFRWDYDTPYKQLIVGDGEKIWIYDEDLEQVTVRPQDASLENTPAQLLSSDEPLESDFSIKDLGEAGDLSWIELVPRDEDATFTSVRLAFRAQDLVVMELHDGLGNQTALKFSNVKKNPPLDQHLFSFSPPAGVDIVGE